MSKCEVSLRTPGFETQPKILPQALRYGRQDEIPPWEKLDLSAKGLATESSDEIRHSPFPQVTQRDGRNDPATVSRLRSMEEFPR